MTHVPQETILMFPLSIQPFNSSPHVKPFFHRSSLLERKYPVLWKNWMPGLF
jgi:hypothetical protein